MSFMPLRFYSFGKRNYTSFFYKEKGSNPFLLTFYLVLSSRLLTRNHGVPQVSDITRWKRYTSTMLTKY